jgi:hypothetical protein
MFVLAGLVGMLCGSGWGAPDIASAQEQTSTLKANTTPNIPFFLFFPPVVKFINGQYTGSLQAQGMNVSFTGTLEYLSGSTQLVKNSSVDTQITTDSWATITPTVINEWEIVSTDPTSCTQEVLAGDNYPQCMLPWQQTTSNTWSLTCTGIGHKATLGIMAVTNSGNQLISLTETTAISTMTTSTTTIQVTSQASTPPPASDFTLPGICSAS